MYSAKARIRFRQYPWPRAWHWPRPKGQARAAGPWPGNFVEEVYMEICTTNCDELGTTLRRSCHDLATKLPRPCDDLATRSISVRFGVDFGSIIGPKGKGPQTNGPKLGRAPNIGPERGPRPGPGRGAQTNGPKIGRAPNDWPGEGGPGPGGQCPNVQQLGP